MVNSAILEVFPNPHPKRNYLIVHTIHEFTSLCPVTGQPDYATFEIRMVAGDCCIELRSLKLYLHAYRSEGIFYEDVTNKILDDLVSVAKPRWIEIKSTWSVRGGISSTIVAAHGDRSVLPPD